MSPPGFVGLLRLDTAFPRPVGDIGNRNTFDFPVRSRIVRGATAARVVRGVASALLQLAWLAPLLPAGRRAGVITLDADALGMHHLAAAGAAPDTPVVGLPRDGALARAVFGDAPRLDRARIREEVVDAGLRLKEAVPSLGAIVLECTNLPPYRDALMRAVCVPVHDCNTLLRWLWAGAARPVPLEPAR